LWFSRFLNVLLLEILVLKFEFLIY